MLPGEKETKMQEIVIWWLRRDLRLEDNKALFHALNSGIPVLPVFIFDTHILEQLSNKSDKRVALIYQVLEQINAKLKKMGSSLLVIHDTPVNGFQKICTQFNVKRVYTNHDYEPYARRRDAEVKQLLSGKGIEFQSFKDQVIFEKSQILKSDGTPYTVFTPYSKKWKGLYFQDHQEQFPSQKYFSAFLKTPPLPFPSLEEIGFKKATLHIPEVNTSEAIISNYHQTRNIPSIAGTSHASVHLRFGIISIRELAGMAAQVSEQWLNELIWREFFMMILYHFPEVEHQNFKKKYDRIRWRNNEEEFELWCKGETGYPIVDAGMRQLNETGWMHNRVRMIVAGFLTKHLLIDWRWGEAYFAEKLLDYELASNNGNWQWAAGTGCDAAPYFRIFNPSEQIKKFDPELKYIKTWIKNFRADYLPPIVEHKYARQRALETYKKALQEL